VTDVFSKEKRSEVMSRIRGKNTTPELKVRSMLHRMGYRFRLHVADLPGKPDIVLPRYKTVVFIHGCFWHRHRGCKLAYTPKTRAEFWARKLFENAKRDEEAALMLQALGWRVITIWECEVDKHEKLEWLANLIKGAEDYPSYAT
jgi:DNA mismatch endonuclease, patch repair protein